MPTTNLIANIGFGEDATHTKRTDDERANVPMIEMSFPLKHPPCMVRDREADNLIVRQVGLGRHTQNLLAKLRRHLLGALPAPLRKSISYYKAKLE